MTEHGLIDVHQHLTPQVYIDRLATVGITGSGEHPWPDCSVSKALDLMDRTGIAAAFTSISSPGLYIGDDAFTRRLARECNDAMAELVRGKPERVGAFAGLPPLGSAAMTATTPRSSARSSATMRLLYFHGLRHGRRH